MRPYLCTENFLQSPGTSRPMPRPNPRPRQLLLDGNIDVLADPGNSQVRVPEDTVLSFVAED